MSWPGLTMSSGVAESMHARGEGMTIIIPSAGQGRRMKTVGAKGLIELRHEETVLSRQIRILSKIYPGADIVVVVGFESEKMFRVIPKYVRVVENELHSITNVVRSIDIGLKATTSDRVMVVYGDLVFNAATVTNLPLAESFVLIDKFRRNRTQIDEQEVGVTVVDDYVTRFDYGLKTKWAQIFFATGRELSCLRRLAAERERRKCFGWELLNAMLDKNGSLRAIEPKGMRIVEIDCSKDIDAAKRVA
jgi:choline kinase